MKCCEPRVRPNRVYSLLDYVEEKDFPKVHTYTRIYARITFAFFIDSTTYQLHSGHYYELNDRYIALILAINPDVIAVNKRDLLRLREIFTTI